MTKLSTGRFWKGATPLQQNTERTIQIIATVDNNRQDDKLICSTFEKQTGREKGAYSDRADHTVSIVQRLTMMTRLQAHPHEPNSTSLNMAGPFPRYPQLRYPHGKFSQHCYLYWDCTLRGKKDADDICACNQRVTVAPVGLFETYWTDDQPKIRQLRNEERLDRLDRRRSLDTHNATHPE